MHISLKLPQDGLTEANDIAGVHIFHLIWIVSRFIWIGRPFETSAMAGEKRITLSQFSLELNLLCNIIFKIINITVEVSVALVSQDSFAS